MTTVFSDPCCYDHWHFVVIHPPLPKWYSSNSPHPQKKKQSGYRRDHIAVLYRNAKNNMTKYFAQTALRARGVMFVEQGGTTLFDRKEVKDILGACGHVRLL